MTHEFECTIKNGLPVLVKAHIISAQQETDTCPYEPVEIEILAVSFKSGHFVKYKLWKNDKTNILNQINSKLEYMYKTY